jgi:predicted enzyme related to lactoylglutathione lyase
MQRRSAMLYVKDLQRMKQFYSDMLGVQPTNQAWTDVWAAFDTRGARFALHAIPAEIAKHIEIVSPPAPREKSAVKLIFEVKDVESERVRLESLGIETIRRPWQQPGVGNAGRAAGTRDCHGWSNAALGSKPGVPGFASG